MTLKRSQLIYELLHDNALAPTAQPLLGRQINWKWHNEPVLTRYPRICLQQLQKAREDLQMVRLGAEIRTGDQTNTKQIAN
jgi:hypothetical protein